METKALLAVRTKSTNGQLNEGINEGRTGKTAGRPCFPLTSGGGTVRHAHASVHFNSLTYYT